MVSEFGKIIRKLRIDKNVSMREMAHALGKSTSYISAIELSNKNISQSILEEIIEYFNLDHESADELKIAADKSNGKVTLSLNNLSSNDQAGVIAFARKFNSLSNSQREKIRRILLEDA